MIKLKLIDLVVYQKGHTQNHRRGLRGTNSENGHQAPEPNCSSCGRVSSFKLLFLNIYTQNQNKF